MLLRKLFVLMVLALPAQAADVALVDDELGQAVLFKNRGLCYAVLPNHVSANRNRIALSVPNPPEVGAAEVFWRDPDNDLALAYVEGGLSDRCQIEFRDMQAGLSDTLQTTESGMIKSVHFGGAFFDRIGALVVDVDDNFVTIRVSDTGIDAEVMQGLSGAMLSVGGKLAGIAIDAQSTGEARFLRMDRIAAIIGSNLSDDHPSTRQIAVPDAGLGFRVTGFESGDQAGAIALEPGSLSAPWIARWSGDPIAFEITLSNDNLVPVKRVRMRTLISDQTTAPRRITLEIDRGMPGNAYWTGLAAPDMAPTGVFEATTGGTVGRRLRIRILDVWHPDRPVRLDGLRIE